MDKFSRKAIVLLLIMIIMAACCCYVQAQQNSCMEYRFSDSNRIYAACNPLPVLDSTLHWNYHPSNHTLDLAYRHSRVTSSNWVAWALNPSGRGMINAQCLVAYVNSSGLPHPYTSPISGYQTTLQEAPLSFRVPSLAAEFINNNEMIIYATLELPPGTTTFNQVWQHGDVSSTGRLLGHPESPQHLTSSATIDFATGTTTATGPVSGGSRQRRRNVHGVLNVVSWGILLPVGVMLARYLKVFKSANPSWFYLHAVCQTSAYVVGVAGWATGLRLGTDSPGVVRTTHRNIGITLFALATLQVFALLLRPKPDHKYRLYWNIYHHSIGYAVISLSIANIFEGFDILDPERRWRRAYIGVLIALGAIAVFLEAFTWFVVLKRRKAESDKHPHTANGENGHTYAAA